MGPKKKAAKAKKASAADEEDFSVDKFWKAYRNNCKTLEVPENGQIKEKYALYQEEGIKISQFNIWDELGWAGTRAIMDALRQVGYAHCISIRLWKTFCEDEGTRAICQYLEIGKPVAILELLDNKITALGCEFISKALHPKMNPSIQILKLDHNEFGSDGVIALSEGLAINPHLRILSLTYCGIDARASQALFEILIYTRSALEDLFLNGNLLRNEGVVKVLYGVAIAKSLKKIHLSDNQFNDDIDVIKAIEFCMTKNTRLGKYDFKYNNIREDGIKSLTTLISTNATHVFEIEIPERIGDKEIFDNFRAALLANKPSKKGKKGKGKKKGKKKK